MREFGCVRGSTLAAPRHLVTTRNSSMPTVGRIRWIVVMVSLVPWAVATAPADEAIRHSLFVAGPDFTGILDEHGKESWNAGRKGARDGHVLENGHVLVAWSDEVQELVPDDANRVVFRYRKAAANKEIGTAVRLADGNTLVTELGAEPRLLEVAPDGRIVTSIPLAPETDNAHMQTRMARKLPNGDYLVPHLLAFKVKQYDATGAVVQAIATDLEALGGKRAENWPFTAIRLANGHTLVTLTHGNKVVEFDPAGQVTWQVSNADFPDVKPFADPCGAQRLPNGNTVIASYGAKQGIKVFEVTPDKRLVWTYDGPFRVHELHVLSTNGVPVPHPPLR
jgi:hypothetical protein